MAVVFDCWCYDLLFFLTTVFAAAYGFFRYKFQHWEKRGLKMARPPTFPMGSFSGLNRTKAMDLLVADIYKESAGEKIVGAYLLAKPIAIVRDLEVAKSVLIKDFGNFHDRGLRSNVEREPLTANLFGMNGQEWRNLRIRLTPIFTSGKMKMMFPTFLDVGKQLEAVLDAATKQDEIEIKDILSRFTTDVISSVAFGLEANSLKNPDVEFRKISHDILHPDWQQQVMMVLIFTAPQWVIDHIPLRFMPERVTKFFTQVVKDTMEYRTKNNVHRNDIMQLLLELKTLGYVRDADNPEKNQSAETQQKFTLEIATAQAFLFFFAGFETSSSTMQFALYELARNPEIQEKLHEEIDQLLEKSEGVLSYEGVMSLQLLDRVVDETLRLYPPAGALMRECNQTTSVPGMEFTFQPGDVVWLPIYGIQHDPQYYPNPEKFDPDRFLPEAKAARPSFAYMPFGEGPRSCIGNRFALMQTKVGLAIILSKFNVAPSKNTPIPIKFDPKVNILTPLGLMPINISKRK